MIFSSSSSCFLVSKFRPLFMSFKHTKSFDSLVWCLATILAAVLAMSYTYSLWLNNASRIIIFPVNCMCWPSFWLTNFDLTSTLSDTYIPVPAIFSFLAYVCLWQWDLFLTDNNQPVYFFFFFLLTTEPHFAVQAYSLYSWDTFNHIAVLLGQPPNSGIIGVMFFMHVFKLESWSHLFHSYHWEVCTDSCNVFPGWFVPSPLPIF